MLLQTNGAKRESHHTFLQNWVRYAFIGFKYLNRYSGQYFNHEGFLNLRKWTENYVELHARVNELSEEQQNHAQHIKNIYELIENLLKPKLQERTPIGLNKS